MMQEIMIKDDNATMQGMILRETMMQEMITKGANDARNDYKGCQ